MQGYNSTAPVIIEHKVAVTIMMITICKGEIK